MQKFITKTKVFLLTCFLGTFASVVAISLTTPIEVQQPTDLAFESPIETTVCEIGDFSNGFNEKLVSFKATTHAFDSELILFPLDCTVQSNNYFFDPSMKLNGFTGDNNNLVGILQSQTTRSTHPDYKDLKEVDIKVIGIVKERYTESGTRQYVIVPKQIEIISAFRQYISYGAA
jgi:hypothetical protein